MTTIVTRDVKGSELTWAEMDANFSNLNAEKLENGEWADNNTLVYRDKDGNLTYLIVGELTIVGRITGGNVAALTAAQVKTLLSLVIGDISGLQTALDGKVASTTFSGNNTVIFKNSSGTITAATIDASRLFGRKATGEITQLTPTEVKTILSLAIADISGLQTALDAKADLTALDTVEGYFGNKQIVHTGSGSLSSGNLTVSWAGFLATDEVYAFHQSFDSNRGALGCSAKSDGVSFTITSDNASDANTVSYFVLRNIS